MNPVSAKRRRQQPARAAAERALGRSPGDGGQCCRCLTWTYVNGHERLARSQGGDPTRPDCLLCRVCNSWCEDKPIEAAWDGWKISRKHPHDPALTDGQARDVYGSVVTFAELVRAS